MKDGQEKIDLLLERNVDEQLKNVDWNKLNSTISSRLDEAQKNKASVRKKTIIFKIATGISVAAAVVLIAVMVLNEILPDEEQNILRQVETVVPSTNRFYTQIDKKDELLSSTDSKTILLTGELHLLSNDPLLAPHSVWDQKPVCKLINNYEMEKVQ